MAATASSTDEQALSTALSSSIIASPMCNSNCTFAFDPSWAVATTSETVQASNPLRKYGLVHNFYRYMSSNPYEQEHAALSTSLTGLRQLYDHI